MENIQRAITLKQELDNLRPINTEQENRIMQKFRLDWNYHSNHLEGNTLTYGETKALILFGVTAQGKPLKDTLEITGHNEAIDWVIDMVKGERPLTENFIRELHKMLLREPYEKKAISPDGLPTSRTINVGSYKTTPNHVLTGTGETFYFASPEETPAKMYDLIEWYKEKTANPETNPILLSAEFHYKFIRIHPFDDGNGRTARILMNFILMQYNFPPVIIKTQDKENYFGVLQMADAGNLEAFVNYIAQNLNRSLEIMIAGANGENIEEEDDLDKEIALLEQRLKGRNKNKEEIEDNIHKIIQNSFFRLYKGLCESDINLDKFYNKKTRMIGLKDNVFEKDEYFNNYYKNILNKRESLLNSTAVCLIHYEEFIYDQWEAYNYISQIKFTFLKDKILITDGYNDELLIKEYYSQLSDEEIKMLLKNLFKKHKQFIEQKMDEQENKL